MRRTLSVHLTEAGARVLRGVTSSTPAAPAALLFWFWLQRWRGAAFRGECAYMLRPGALRGVGHAYSRRLERRGEAFLQAVLAGTAASASVRRPL